MLSPIHSHNDELQESPFTSAISAISKCIETDVYLIDEQFMLGHEYSQLLKPTFMEMYMQPLIEIFQKSGTIYPKGTLILLIDCKVEEAHAAGYTKYSAEDFYDKLESLLLSISSSNPGIFTTRTSTSVLPGAIDVVLSGTRPSPNYVTQRSRWLLSLDARMPNLLDAASIECAHVYPMYSDALAVYLGGTRFDPTPKLADLTDDQIGLIRKHAEKAHQQGALFRVWGCPDEPTAWATQIEWGCDLVSTDFPLKCRDWLIENGYMR
eukprot:GDKJ01003762.1.p1 GENE.GDKJ01003762.1~~GDKJ01003762.1.p1  ORF type:complete len:266 (+),score=40.84 GDKJ01003762.1:34-831(+)